MGSAFQAASDLEAVIHTPDGRTRALPLDRERITLGRASTNELCYPDDAGLSRQHLTFEAINGVWVVRDLGSKNGTLVNGNRIESAHRLVPGDRVTAGHLIIEMAARMAAAPVENKTVMFVENPVTPISTTLATSLETALSSDAEKPGSAQMRALIRIGRELGGNLSLDDMFRLIMELSIDAVGAARGVLMTVESGGELIVRAAKGDGFRISTKVRDTVVKERQSLLVHDARLDRAFSDRMSIVEQQIRSIVAVPLQTESRVIGLIYLDSPHFVREFTRDDLNLLTVMANVAAIRIENARLAEVEQAERVMAREMEQAAVIQRGLLPSRAPNFPGIDLAGYNSPCRTVGGDYYDFIPYDDGRIALLVADVAGKGMPAAMLMSNLQARVQVLFDDPHDLAALITRLNKIMSGTCPSNRFISLFVGVYDTKTGDLTYCNAGHNPPLIVRCDGAVEELSSTGIVLGILPAFKYTQKICHLELGDAIVLFSDGVTEACQPAADEQFGEERLADILKRNRCATAEAVSQAIQKELTDWMGGAPPADDITLMVARRV